MSPAVPADSRQHKRLAIPLATAVATAAAAAFGVVGRQPAFVGCPRAAAPKAAAPTLGSASRLAGSFIPAAGGPQPAALGLCLLAATLAVRRQSRTSRRSMDSAAPNQTPEEVEQEIDEEIDFESRPDVTTIETMRKFSNQYAKVTDTVFCADKAVAAVVLSGLAHHKETLGAPLCPCRHYEDKQAEAKAGYWNCPCLPMRERHECHCMLFLERDNEFASQDCQQLELDEILKLSSP